MWPQCAWQTFKLYTLKHFGFRETFKMVNVPMLRKTFCPHPDCKGTKPFRVTNYKSLNEEVTSRKRRLRCWWFDAFYPDVYYSKCKRLGLRYDYLGITRSLPNVQWKCLAGSSRGARENFCLRQSAQFVSGRPRSDVKIGLFVQLFNFIWSHW